MLFDADLMYLQVYSNITLSLVVMQWTICHFYKVKVNSTVNLCTEHSTDTIKNVYLLLLAKSTSCQTGVVGLNLAFSKRK